MTLEGNCCHHCETKKSKMGQRRGGHLLVNYSGILLLVKSFDPSHAPPPGALQESPDHQGASGQESPDHQGASGRAQRLLVAMDLGKSWGFPMAGYPQFSTLSHFEIFMDFPIIFIIYFGVAPKPLYKLTFDYNVPMAQKASIHMLHSFTNHPFTVFYGQIWGWLA